VVLPLVLERPDAGCSARRHLPAKRERVPLVDREAAMTRADVILVALAARRARDEPFEDAGLVVARGERVTLAVPAVEIPDDGDEGGIRRPHREVHARLAVLPA